MAERDDNAELDSLVTPTSSARHPLVGALASGVARQMAAPLRQLRETLAVMVESLDEHVHGAAGPDPYPWKKLHVLRQELAEAYLTSRTIARLAGDLADGLSRLEVETPELIDINKQVEAALNLSRHAVSSATEIFVDLGSVPLVRAAPSGLMVTLAEMLLLSAQSVSAIDGSALSIKTRCDDAEGEVVIYIADNGRGIDTIEDYRAALDSACAVVPANLTFASEPNGGCVFELRMAVRR